jgi:hypothetical protein
MLSVPRKHDLAGHGYISSSEAYLQNEMDVLTEEVQQYHPFDYEARRAK